MKTEDLIDFIRNGCLQNFPFGTTQDQIISDLGETDSWIQISRMDRRKALLKYDRTEFYFDDKIPQSLNGIMITSSRPSSRFGLIMNYHGIDNSTDFDSIMNILHESNIQFGIKDQETIRTANGVELYFFEDNYLDRLGKFVK